MEIYAVQSKLRREVRDGVTIKGKRFFAAIEPKHGTTVAVYLETRFQFWQRRVLDETLKDGHALAIADFLGTGGDQVVGRLARYEYARCAGRSFVCAAR